ncbi:polysaccharide lyase family 14 protein [Crassisporium funariophilum]|nr:polysaccharide lyase family 14 protein [Crassisporium funariophilum]
MQEPGSISPSFSHLLPIAAFQSGFTTCCHIQHERIQNVVLNDQSLGVHKITSRTTHKLVQPPATAISKHDHVPSPDFAWEAFYPAGSINPSAEIPGGFGFYLSGPPSFAAGLETAKEVVLSYRMMLQTGWEWVKGGKLPGVCKFGGVGDLSYGCTGGRKEQRCQCFDLRPMWRANSVGELYIYLPIKAENSTRLASVPPRSIENNDYGFSVGRGAFHMDGAVGQWVTLAFRIKLNDIGINNGEVQVWIDGNSVVHVDGLSLRESQAGRIKGMHFQTFFGGNSQDWASPKDQRAWFADVTGAIIC